MNAKKSLIFIVEDDFPCGKLIYYFLKKHGFKNTELFTRAEDCLINMERKPAVIITDYRLKSMNGLHLIQECRNIYSDFYCILLSGLDMEYIASKEPVNQYIDRYIMKGCNGMDELLMTLNGWLHNQYVEHYY